MGGKNKISETVDVAQQSAQAPDKTADPQVGSAADPAHPKTAKEKAQEFVTAIRERDDVFDAKNNTNWAELDADTLKYMVDHKMIVELKPGDLTYDAVRDLRFGQVPDKKGHYKDPIYLMPGVGSDKAHAEMLIINSQPNGPFPSLVTEGYHEYSAKYLRNHINSKDTDIAQDSTVTKADDYKAETPDAQKRYDAMLAQIAQIAKEDGMDPPKVIISSVSGSGALQSKEGTKYLMINQDELKEALTTQDPQKQADFNDMLKNELQRIKNGGTAPATIVHDRMADEEARAKVEYEATISPSWSNRNYLPDSNRALVRESTLNEMVSEGKLIKVGKKDLDPSAGQDPVIKDAEKRHLPIYVVAAAGAGNTDSPQSELMHTTDNKEYVVVNERYHKWTEDYAQKMQSTDAGIAEAVTKGNLSTPEDFLNKEVQDPAQRAEMQARLERVENGLNARAKAQGVENIQLVVDTSAGRDYTPTGISSDTSKEGTNRIYISKEYLMESLASDEAANNLVKGNIGRDFGHELGHIQDKDSLPSGTVRFHDIASAREAELKATLQGSGPMGSHAAEADAKRLEDELRANATGTGPGGEVTDKDMKTLSDKWARSDPEHYSSLVAIAALKEEAALMKAYEVKFAQDHGHAVTTDAERQAETQAVLDQVMKDMRDKVRMAPEPAPPVPQNTANGFTADQQAHMDAARQNIGSQQVSEAHAQSTAYTPAAPARAPSQQVASRA